MICLKGGSLLGALSEPTRGSFVGGEEGDSSVLLHIHRKQLLPQFLAILAPSKLGS